MKAIIIIADVMSVILLAHDSLALTEGKSERQTHCTGPQQNGGDFGVKVERDEIFMRKCRIREWNYMKKGLRLSPKP